MMNTMKAVVLTKPTSAKDIVLSEIPVPQAVPGWVVVKIYAFGMNHSEQILRQSEIENDYIKKPIIPGIECVGEIVDICTEDASSENAFPMQDENKLKKSLSLGQKVVALMGGMGRSFNGSYAEYALLPIHHVFPVKTDLSWTELASIPETYFTAWGSLFECLNLKAEDTLLIRGATCALGYASIQIARALGCHVVATTHRESKLHLLEKAGANECVLDDGSLSEKYAGQFSKVLELVGCKTVCDSLQCVYKGGIVCNTGVLGGVFALNDFDPIKDIPNGVFLTGFFSNTPTQKDIDAIFDFLEKHHLKPLVGKVFPFSQIANACDECDSGKVNGKIVVAVN